MDLRQIFPPGSCFKHTAEAEVAEVAGRNVLIRHTVIGAEQVKCLSLKGLIRELLVEADRLSRTVNTRNTFPTLVNNI